MSASASPAPTVNESTPTTCTPRYCRCVDEIARRAAICVVASATATTSALIVINHRARVASPASDGIVETATPRLVANSSQ